VTDKNIHDAVIGFNLGFVILHNSVLLVLFADLSLNEPVRNRNLGRSPARYCRNQNSDHLPEVIG
jgi:hypothetical protein